MGLIWGERRKYFRVRFTPSLPGKLQIISLNNKQIDLDKYLPVKILDLSAGGAKVKSSAKLPVITDLLFQISFELQNHPFSCFGNIIRLKEETNDYVYGIKFTSITATEEQILLNKLNEFQFKKIKYQRSAEIKKDINGSLLKILDILPYAAFLVTFDRRIIASNKKDLRINQGEKCYKAIFKNERVCPYCRLDECLSKEEIFEHKIIVKGTKYTAHWGKLESDIFIHYFDG